LRTSDGGRENDVGPGPRGRARDDEGSGSTFVEYDGKTQTISAEYPYNSPSGAGNVYALAGARRTAVGNYASGSVGSATINYLADDGQGNVSTADTQGGSMACTAWSDAWGVPMSPLSGSNACNTGSTINTEFYRASRRDSITGDYQFGPRTYDPQTGSFLQPDTYRGSQPGSSGSVVSDPLTENRYSFVNGDPLNLIDPSGHYAVPAPGGVPYVDDNSLGSHNNYAPKNANNLPHQQKAQAGCDCLDVSQGSVEDANERASSPWYVCQKGDSACGEITSKYGCAYFYTGRVAYDDSFQNAEHIGVDVNTACAGWTDYYKGRAANGYHWGVDISMQVGTPIVAPEGGQIVDVEYGIVGIRVDPDHVVYLLHVDSIAPGLKKGDTVKPGVLVAYSGNKTPGGGSSSGPHLHFELRTYSDAQCVSVNHVCDYSYNQNRITTSNPSQILDANWRS
jgi:RHS repeat-associated protein